MKEKRFYLFVFGLLAFLSIAFAEDKIVLNYNAQFFGENNILYLKQAMKEQHPQLNPQDFRLIKVRLVAKSQNGLGTAYLKVGQTNTYTSTIWGNPYLFWSDDIDTFDKQVFDAPVFYNSQMAWQIVLNGNIRVKKVVLFVEREYQPNCPYGYHWDYTFNKCVRDVQNCPAGYHWDYNLERCVSNQPSCPYGYHWDNRLNMCVRDIQNCPNGYIWDHRLERCVRTQTSCPAGQHWDNRLDRCVRDIQSCPSGYVWDATREKCVRTSPNDTNPSQCPRGQHWDRKLSRCIRN